MSNGTVEKARRIRRLLVILPFVMTALIGGSALIGMLLERVIHTGDSLTLPLLFSTAGLVLSVLMAAFLARRI